MTIRHARFSTNSQSIYRGGNEFSEYESINEVLTVLNSVQASIVSIESNVLTYDESPNHEIVFDIFYTSKKKP